MQLLIIYVIICHKCLIPHTSRCPQGTARKGNYGSHLLQNTELVKHILTRMVNEINLPITAKIRIFDDDQKTINFCLDLERIGISMLTVHGRTVHANKLYVGASNWKVIREIKSRLSIPVIANGGVSCYSDAIRCLEVRCRCICTYNMYTLCVCLCILCYLSYSLHVNIYTDIYSCIHAILYTFTPIQETGCDGVMSSEALLENPKLFSPSGKGDLSFHNDYINCQLDTITEYMSYVNSFYKHMPKDDNIRSPIFKILHRFFDAPQNYDLRARVAEGNIHDMMYAINELKHRMSKVDNDVERAMSLGMLGQTYWYYRHRDEKAKVRIMTTPRVAHRLKARPTSTTLTTSTCNDDVKVKLEALKARLREKQATATSTTATLSQTSSANSSASSSSSGKVNSASGFTRFMNRNSTLVP